LAQATISAHLAAAVLTGLTITAWGGGCWIDPLVALGIAAWAVIEGRDAWRGDACGC
jgi:divalent metal cation (Fe/Co/Zn/Cd) transporter